MGFPPRLGQGQDIGALNAAKVEGAAVSNLLRMLIYGSGMLSSSGYEASLFTRSSAAPARITGAAAAARDPAAPDLQVSVFAGGGDKDMIKNLRLLSDGFIPDEALSRTSQGILFISTVLHPQSEGSIRLRSADPFAHPVIDAGYLSDPTGRDLAVVVEGLRLLCRLAAKPSYAGLLASRPHLPTDLLKKHAIGPDAPAESLPDAFWEDYVRQIAMTLYHPVGTCGIGRVVSPDLKVLGIDGLRVADASVMPHIVSANTNASSIMIGERAADFIRAEHGLFANPAALEEAAQALKGARSRFVVRVLSALSVVLAVSVAAVAWWAVA